MPITKCIPLLGQCHFRLIQGLLEAVADWLPHAEQKKCTRHVVEEEVLGVVVEVEKVHMLVGVDMVEVELLEEDELRNALDHEYMKHLIIEEEEKRMSREKEILERQDEKALQQAIEEEREYERQDDEKETYYEEQRQWDFDNDYLNPKNFTMSEEDMDVDAINKTLTSNNLNVNTQEYVAVYIASDVVEPAIAEGVVVAEEGVSVLSTTRGRSKGNKVADKPALPFRIYHKNSGKSERIAKMQAKKFKIDDNETSLSVDKALKVEKVHMLVGVDMVEVELLEEDELRNALDHEYMKQLIIEEEEKRMSREKEILERQDEKALQQAIEEEREYERQDEEKETYYEEQRQWDFDNDYLNPKNFTMSEEDMDVDAINKTLTSNNLNVNTQEYVAVYIASDVVEPAIAEGVHNATDVVELAVVEGLVQDQTID
nr:hypothetical protein [Tanacetum cinerariifolium]